MSGSAETGLYVKGRDLQLDKRYSEYKKLNLWRGLGLSLALSKEEGTLSLTYGIKIRELRGN